MLVGGGVKDIVRSVLIEQGFDAPRVADVGDLDEDLSCRELPLQPAAQQVEPVLVQVDLHEPAQARAQELSADLAPDRARGAGHQGRPAVQ